MSFSIARFIEELIVYDYILLGSTFFIFITLVILAIVKRNKTYMSIFLFTLAFSIAILSPTIIRTQMHKVLFKNSATITDKKELTYTNAVIVYAKVKNTSKYNFSICKIEVDAYKVSGNSIKDYLFKLNPFLTASSIEYDIAKGEEIDIKVILEPFIYEKDYNISIGASCR
jgi:hypothetical protein